MEKVLAAAPVNLGSSIGGEGLGPFGKTLPGGGAGGATTGLINITKIVSSVIGVMTVAAMIWFIFNFIIGGIQWIASGGDKHNLEQSQQRITNAFMGLLIVAAGWTILALAGKFLGIDTLISAPGKFIDSLFPGTSIQFPTP